MLGIFFYLWGGFHVIEIRQYIMMSNAFDKNLELCIG